LKVFWAMVEEMMPVSMPLTNLRPLVSFGLFFEIDLLLS
jgi:hypothetical protein